MILNQQVFKVVSLYDAFSMLILNTMWINYIIPERNISFRIISYMK